MAQINTVLFLGKPGAGKGTQAKKLATDLRWKYYATGDFLRELSQRTDIVGTQVRDLLACGCMLPEFLITTRLTEWLRDLDPAEGVVLDGIGRSIRQAEEAFQILEFFKREFVAINIEVSNDTVRNRLLARSKVEVRTDSDDLTKIDRRMSDYDWITRPALNHFEKHGVVKCVDGEQSVEEVYAAVRAHL